MPRLLSVALTASFGALRVIAGDPFTFCSDKECGNCPVSVTSIGTGYPDCAIYSVADVFGNQGFDTDSG
jgi:hypothetical protein